MNEVQSSDKLWGKRQKEERPVRVAVLVSGGGLSLQSLIDANVFGALPNCELAAVISSRADSYALKRAEMAGIPTYLIDRNLFPGQTVFGFAILDKLRDLDIELVVIAGFEDGLIQPILRHYAGKIIDSYPSLMPAFVGEGLEGLRLPEAMLRMGVKLTGATAYFVTERPNSGPIILQKALAVREDDTAAVLQRRLLLEAENYVLPRAVALYCQGKLKIADGIVKIAETAEDEPEQMSK